MNFRILIFLLPLLFTEEVAFAQQDSPAIVINGADEALESNIRSHLRIAGESCDSPLPRLERLLPRVFDNVQRAANALGYYRLTATGAFSSLESCWQLTLEVQPGEPVMVNEVSIHLPDTLQFPEIFDAVLAELPDLVGKPLNHGEYESIKNTLSAAAVENGYFSARFTRSEIRVDMAAYQADILIDFDPGQRYRIGVIRVLPVAGFSDTFINRMVILQTGEPYSSDRLLAQRNSMDDTQYFRQINITPQLSSADNLSVPIIIELDPRPRHAYSAGVGFTTDTGPRIRAAYENRYINRRGHHLDGDASVSKVRLQTNLGYVIPLKNPLATSLKFRTGYIAEDTDTYSSDRFKLETSLQDDDFFGWQANYFVDYLRDDYTVNLQTDTANLTMLGYSLSKTHADDFINPSKGWRLTGQVRGASDSLLSDTSFLQLYASGKGILSLGRGRFITRFEAGTTMINDAFKLPASVRYFAGGDQSLRGYDYRSLGPKDSDGVVIGGKHLLTGSVEYDFPVGNSWRTAVFYDAGNAFSTHEFTLKHSVGFGIRWLSPIGPIRADLAHPLHGEGGIRLHITMGPDL